MKFDVCGFETITNNQTKDINMTLDINEKNGTYKIIDAKSIFKSSDSDCPIVDYDIETSKDGVAFTKYNLNLFSLDTNNVLNI